MEFFPKALKVPPKKGETNTKNIEGHEDIKWSWRDGLWK